MTFKKLIYGLAFIGISFALFNGRALAAIVFNETWPGTTIDPLNWTQSGSGATVSGGVATITNGDDLESVSSFALGTNSGKTTILTLKNVYASNAGNPIFGFGTGAGAFQSFLNSGNWGFYDCDSSTLTTSIPVTTPTDFEITTDASGIVTVKANGSTVATGAADCSHAGRPIRLYDDSGHNLNVGQITFCDDNSNCVIPAGSSTLDSFGFWGSVASTTIALGHDNTNLLVLALALFFAFLVLWLILVVAAKYLRKLFLIK